MLKTMEHPVAIDSIVALHQRPSFCEIDEGFIDRSRVVGDVIHARQTVRPKHLAKPAPDAAQLHNILTAAGAAPDHGQLLPWRFVIVPESQRAELADTFVHSLIERDHLATPEQVTRAQEKAYRSPLLMLVVVDIQRGDVEIDHFERTLSAGCAVQNILLLANSLGFGSALTSGKALKAEGFRALFGLQDGEVALCFINIGTATLSTVGRRHPSLVDYVSVLGQA